MFDMNRAYFKRKEDVSSKWEVIDAKGKVLGRLATEIAVKLLGKNKPTFTKHTDSGDYIIIINSSKIELKGKNKWTDKNYVTYSQYIGNKKEFSPKEIFDKNPNKLIELAVKRMLPKNKLAAVLFKKLKIYTGETHPHQAQVGVNIKNEEKATLAA